MTGTRVLLLAALALSVVTSAGAFSAVDADRQVGVTVVEDANAYLGITEVQSVASDSIPGEEMEDPAFRSDCPQTPHWSEPLLCVHTNGKVAIIGPGIDGWGEFLGEVPDGLLGSFDDQNTIATSGSTATVFRVQNRFTEPVTVTASDVHSPAGLTVSDVHTTDSGTIDPGESTDVRATFECDTSVYDAEVSFTDEAAGDGVSATRHDKSVRVTCIAG